MRKVEKMGCGRSKIVGIAVALFIIGVLSIAMPAIAESLLIEAENFTEKGGWVVDQQFVEQMGSPYLLAHGLGEPVANAVTTVAVPTAGKYRVWVRTKDWVPGEWDAPGRFKVRIGAKLLEQEFGVNPGWAWRLGGDLDLAAGDLKVELIDLTGFDGRCDAILLTTDKQMVPPNKDPAMLKFRRELMGLPAVPPSAGDFDLVVVGGGIAGCAAALAADEYGLKVALIQDRPVLGGNASSEVRVHTEGIHGEGKSILSKLDTIHWPNGSPKSMKDDIKRHKAMDAAENVEIFLGWRAFGVEVADQRIKAVHARNVRTGIERSFQSPLFVDATGDGWIGYWAGADHAYGRESYETYDEKWDKHGELWSPKEPDNRVMGASLIFWPEDAGEPCSFPAVPWAEPVAKDMAAMKGQWFWEYVDNDLHIIDDGETIRDHILRAIYGAFANAKERSENANGRLEFVGYVLGKRESRRLMGDHIYSMKDATESRRFPDTVVEETRAVDIHYQRQYKDPSYPYDFLSTALYYRVDRYYIPYRSLYSRNIENLFMAGRCFSCSHVGLGGPRVMNTTGQMGIAVGYAAAICRVNDCDPRDVYEQHIDRLRKMIGRPEFKEKDPVK